LTRSRDNIGAKLHASEAQEGGGERGPEVIKRRRRKAEAAESEILEAAANFLRERPFREMTVDRVMERTELARPSFYEYFRDRYHLVTKLYERLGDPTYQVAEIWLSGANEAIEQIRAGVESFVRLYLERGFLLLAIADAATNDKRVEAAHREFLDRFITTVAERMRTGLGGDAIKGVDPKEVATALVLMNERYLVEKLRRGEQVDPAVAAETLFIIWKRVLYGT
jgi:TetR/AcrR family transcriptional regulator, ethionamide resistance regulator